MELALSDQERALLIDLLDADFRELKEEINHTEAYAYKIALKERERLLVDLLGRLEAPPYRVT